MDAKELRAAFTGFFADRGHTVVPSASLIPHDPTVLFTVAGMVPFKPYFVGEEVPPYRRATSVQKVVRAGGKHNDLDAIGRTSRHLSFFEMLGNFGFGDYFKAEAIPWAWEFFTQTLGLDPERLWVTVHITDDEAEAIWRDSVGVPAERIQRLDEDNFWRMADVGPCGPCSEIFWDQGPEYGADGGPAHGAEERFVEIWNLVFMQYDQQPDGTLVPLPKPSIDTGAGLERVLSVLQGVDTVFDTNELRHLIDVASAVTGVPYGGGPTTDVSLRILAEHARTVTFLVSDGVFPSNEDRGYVLRRIIRRAVRHAFLLGVSHVVMPEMVDAVVSVMGQDYPDVARNHSFVRDVIRREEERFRETLATGSTILDQAIGALGSGEPLPGAVAFRLHDTYGFPLEVTQEVAAERSVEVDLEGFRAEMAEQRDRAKAARKGNTADANVGLFADLAEQFGPTDFTGREEYASKGRVLAVVPAGPPPEDVLAEADGAADRPDTPGGSEVDAPGGLVSIVLDRTPFYAESGGQVGDIGIISTDTGRAVVVGTNYAVAGLHRHLARIDEGSIAPGQEALAEIDADRRDAIRRNHTGTHILHWALREVLGDHVKQQGSLVDPLRLRFDFSHYQPLTTEELRSVEDLANREILSNEPVRHYETTKEAAAELGAIAFFGDKYGDVVRVLEAGTRSIELCGGTHVRATGDIGPIKIVSEGSIGSNIRRLEAVTGTGTIDRLRAEEDLLGRVADTVGVPVDQLVEGVEKRLAELDVLRKEVKALRRQAASGQAEGLVGSAVGGVIVSRVDADSRDELRDMALSLRDHPGVETVVLGAALEGGGVAIVSAVTPESGRHAADLISQAARMVGGGTGKSPDLAMAGGKDPAQLDDALDHVRTLVA